MKGRMVLYKEIIEAKQMAIDALEDSCPQLRSVEEELPPCDQPYIDNHEEVDDIKMSKPVAVIAEGGYHIATLNQNYDPETGEKNGEPYWFDENKPSEGDWLNELVTHWAPLPELPKGGLL